jgi:hypothetical protein
MSHLWPLIVWFRRGKGFWEKARKQKSTAPPLAHVRILIFRHAPRPIGKNPQAKAPETSRVHDFADSRLPRIGHALEITA